MAVRKPGISGRSTTGFYHSLKTGRTHYFESGLERDFIYLLEFDPLVETFEEQPFIIRYKDHEGKSRRYTPDFLVRFTTDGHIKHKHECCVYEVKYKLDIEKYKNLLKPKFKAAKEFVKSNNWKFEVITELAFNEDVLSNCKFLDQFYSPEKYEVLSDEDFQKIPKNRTFTAKEFLSSVSSSPSVHAQVVPSIWHMAATGRLSFNMNERITINTKFTLNDERR